MAIRSIGTIPENLPANSIWEIDVEAEALPTTIFGRLANLDDLIFDQDIVGGFTPAWAGNSSITAIEGGYKLVLGRRAYSAGGLAVFWADGAGANYPGASDEDPEALAEEASPGTDEEYARGDHVHPLPTADDIAFGDVSVSEALDALSDEIEALPPGSISVTSYAALRAVAAGTNQMIYVQGQSTAQDGGQGWFRYDPASSATVDNATVIQPTMMSGRFLRARPKGVFHADWFNPTPASGGPEPDGTECIQRALNAAAAEGPGGVVLLASRTAKTYTVQRLLEPANSTSLTCVDGVAKIYFEAEYGGGYNSVLVASTRLPSYYAAGDAYFDQPISAGVASGYRTGTGDTLVVASTGLPGMVLTDSAAPWTAADVGRYIRLSGATSSGNNGIFLITYFGDASNILIHNPSGVAESFAAGTWSIAQGRTVHVEHTGTLSSTFAAGDDVLLSYGVDPVDANEPYSQIPDIIESVSDADRTITLRKGPNETPINNARRAWPTGALTSGSPTVTVPVVPLTLGVRPDGLIVGATVTIIPNDGSNGGQFVILSVTETSLTFTTNLSSNVPSGARVSLGGPFLHNFTSHVYKPTSWYRNAYVSNIVFDVREAAGGGGAIQDALAAMRQAVNCRFENIFIESTNGGMAFAGCTNCTADGIYERRARTGIHLSDGRLFSVNASHNTLLRRMIAQEADKVMVFVEAGNRGLRIEDCEFRDGPAAASDSPFIFLQSGAGTGIVIGRCRFKASSGARILITAQELEHTDFRTEDFVIEGTVNYFDLARHTGLLEYNGVRFGARKTARRTYRVPYNAAGDGIVFTDLPRGQYARVRMQANNTSDVDFLYVLCANNPSNGFQSTAAFDHPGETQDFPANVGLGNAYTLSLDTEKVLGFITGTGVGARDRLTLEIDYFPSLDEVDAVAAEASVVVSSGELALGGAALSFGNAAPSTGVHAAGDICFNSEPSLGEPVFWRCTVAGAPGTHEAVYSQAPRVYRAHTGTSDTTVLGDGGNVVTSNNAGLVTQTIPANSSVAYPLDTIIEFIQLGAGGMAFVLTTDTFIVPAGFTAVSAGQGHSVFAKKIGTTTWQLSGGLEPV